MLMSSYHKCKPVRHKHKHNEAALFDISGNIIENSAQSLPADLQFQDGVFYRFLGKNSDPLAEAVRIYPCLHHKASPDFKDNKKKNLAWQDVAKAVSIENGKLT